jgi:hypothetical protein
MGRNGMEGGPKDVGDFRIREAVEEDVPLIFQFIKKLAHFEQLSGEVSATEELLRKNLFGERREIGRAHV